MLYTSGRPMAFRPWSWAAPRFGPFWPGGGRRPGWPRLRNVHPRDEQMKRGIYLLPVAGFVLLAYFLFKSLWAPSPSLVPSALLNKPAPRLVLPGLDDRSAAFTPGDLAAGHVSVVNVIASWCAPCRTEAPQLAELAKVPGIALYGMTQKDKPAAPRAFLQEVGNPFSRIARDDEGRASIEWGV